MAAAALLLSAAPASAQPSIVAPPRPPGVATISGGVVRGVVSSQSGAIPLGGVLVSLTSDRTSEVRTVRSEGDGSFVFAGLEAGEYLVSAALDGFDPRSAAVRVAYNGTASVVLDLRIAISERVDVVAGDDPVIQDAGTLTSSDVVDSKELDQLAPGGGFQAALKLLASVIEVPGGVAIKGGRPSQATVQLGPGTFVDPATGLSQVRLPDDAIDSVTVLPNPYAVEFGRFSSGLVLIQTRRAGDTWRMRLNNLDPTFRTSRGTAFDIRGIASFSPRVEIGGPIVKDRVRLQQAAQYRYRTSDVPSRPQDELRRSHAFSSFTRLDASLSPRHSLVAMAGVFPMFTEHATLGTFTPLDASADIRGGVSTGALTARTFWTDVLFSETTVEVNRYRTDVRPQGRLSMELLPETTLGHFFNRQHRTADTYQVIETLAGSAQRGDTLHLFKLGIDVLHNRFRGTSASSPVLIRDSAGALVRRLDFAGPTAQAIDSTDVAVFAQDRVQPAGRWYVEFGARFDRDGVVRRLNVTPRVGSALLLNQSGTTVLRGGVGLFYERTPSTAGVFDQYERATDWRVMAPGAPFGVVAAVAHRMSSDLRTARSATWDVAFDHHFSSRWALNAGVIDRRGDQELLVLPVVGAAGAELRLTSTGRSQYREAEVGLHYTEGDRADVKVSYVRARARSDTNAFTNYFDAVRWPITAENAYAPARTEVPHRLLLTARVLPTPSWLVVCVVDWRSGLPYSTVNEVLEFVGPRNVLRFPTYVRTELGLEHRIRVGKLRPWVGVRVDNALNAWLPSDVQNNVSSPAFGTFYNSEYRQFRIQLRFQR